MKKLYSVFILIGVMVLFVLFNKLSYGPSQFVLVYEIIKNLLLILFCISPVILIFIKRWREKEEYKMIQKNQFTLGVNDDSEERSTLEESEVKKNPFEYTPQPNTNKMDLNFATILACIIGGILAFFMLFSLWRCVLDVIQGPVQIVLTDTAYAKHTSTTGTGYKKRTRIHYELEGYSIDGQKYDFRINGIDDELTTIINNQNPPIVVTIYPNSQTLIQVDIHTSNGIITLPEGKEPKLNPVTGEQYSASELENVHIFEDVDFANYINAMNELDDFIGQPIYDAMDEFFYAYDKDDVDYGFHLKDSNDENYSLYKSITEAIKEEKEISGNLECKVLFKDDIAIVFVYNINTERVSNVYALRCLSLSK